MTFRPFRSALTRAAVAVAILGLARITRAELRINEVMASNSTTLADEDGDYPDWIEIFNPDPTVANLAGWYLTDNATDKTKWQFPAVAIPSGGFLVVFASNKNRRDPARTLHTNFVLNASGDYLALLKPDGVTTVSEFAPKLPPQSTDISYGVSQAAPGEPATIGYFRKATPGAANGGRSALMLIELVTMSRPAGPFPQAFDLTLAGAGAVQRIRYVLARPSKAGAEVPEPTAASPEYSAPLRIDSSVIVRAAVFSADNSVVGRVATAQFVNLESNVVGFASSLPVIVLDNHGFGELDKDGIGHPAWLYAYNRTGPVFTGVPTTATPTTMTLRGNFSANFLKSSFSLTLQNTSGRDEPQSLLGLDAHEDWALVGPWLTDRSYIRNAFIYALSTSIGRWAPRTRFVETFLNNNGNGIDSTDYYGIGVLTDRLSIAPDRIAVTSMSSSDEGPRSITGGYLVKFDPVPDDKHYNFITDHGIPSAEGTAVVVDTPVAAKLSLKQRDYIRGYVQAMENTLYANRAAGFGSRTYLDFIDLPSWIDHHILELLSGNVDGLYRSEYFTKDREGKLVAGPVWDFDGSLGNGDPRNDAWDNWNTSGPIDPWNYGWFGLLVRDPEFMQGWIDRWQTLRRDQFADSKLAAVADSLAAAVGTEAAARDAARWVDNQSRYPGGFLGEVTHLKDWVTQRARWFDRQFVGAPTASTAGGSLTFTAPAGAQLIYTLDGSDPRGLGGAIAPGAVTTSSPFTVTATANVHVRSYRADLAGAFPGSPWSSAAAGPDASPLSPVARIVNLSSRALVGAGEDALIAGVTVADTLRKAYLARGVGPTLASFGVANALPDPTLSVFSSTGAELFGNITWGTGADAAKLPALASSVGAFPLAPGSADSALIAPLATGGYTVRIVSATARPGVGLVELYASDDNGRTLNLSTRARVRTGEGLLFGGFVVRGPAYKRMLIRAVGPTLRAFGVGDALIDPIVKIYAGQTVVATNDDWATGNAPMVAAASASVGAFALPTDSKDAALLVTLPPGPYTVEISGKGETEGVALLEIYEVP